MKGPIVRYLGWDDLPWRGSSQAGMRRRPRRPFPPHIPAHLATLPARTRPPPPARTTLNADMRPFRLRTFISTKARKRRLLRFAAPSPRFPPHISRHIPRLFRLPRVACRPPHRNHHGICPALSALWMCFHPKHSLPPPTIKRGDPHTATYRHIPPYPGASRDPAGALASAAASHCHIPPYTASIPPAYRRANLGHGWGLKSGWANGLLMRGATL